MRVYNSRLVRVRWTMLTLLAAGCRFGSGGVADGGVPIPDIGTTDTRSEPEAGACVPDAGVCCGQPDGRRVCDSTPNASAACLAGQPVDDRECPPGSTCQDFLCAPDTACQVCGAGCGATQMCGVFVTAGSPPTTNYCCTPCFLDARGCGAPGTPCSTAEQCASGICVASDGGTDGGPPDGGTGQCFQYCQTSATCGDGGTCQPRRVSVDGLSRVLNTCLR
jgi:hypothetical protein